MPKTTVNVALIGCGNLGKVHAQCLAKIPNAKLLATCDVAEAPAAAVREQFGAEYATIDVEKIWSDNRIDAVYICTRHDSHAPLSVAAAKAKKHVLIEKPIAVTVEQCRQIEDAVKPSGIVYMPAFKMRYYPVVTQAREFIPRPQVQFGQIIKKRWSDERWDMLPEQGGGPILNQGCHTIDLTRFLQGSDATHVYAVGGTHTHPGHPFPDQCMASVRFANGTGANFIQGDAGAASFTGDFFWEIFADDRSVQIYKRCMAGTFNDNGKVWVHEDPEELAFQLENDDFIAAILEGREGTKVGLWDGIQATRIPLAAIESIRHNRVVDVSKERWERERQ